MEEYTKKDLKNLNSQMGLKYLLTSNEVDVARIIKNVKVEKRLKDLQVELLKLQSWVQRNNKRVIILFEGRDAAGKGGTIRRITEYLNPRLFRIVALPKPTLEESQQWYFQRYVYHLPKNGEIVFFDRSWYNRAVIEPVMGFCSEEEHLRFMDEVNGFERMLVTENSILLKFYLSISKEEQEKRFTKIKNNPLKRWKFSNVDQRAQELWDKYTVYKEKMFRETNTPYAPWKIIQGNKKGVARLEIIEEILKSIPYQEDTNQES